MSFCKTNCKTNDADKKEKVATSSTAIVSATAVVTLKPMVQVRNQLSALIVTAIAQTFKQDLSDMKCEIGEKGLNKIDHDGRIAFPLFVVSKRLNKLGKESEIGVQIADALQKLPTFSNLLDAVEPVQHNLNLMLSAHVLTSVIPLVLDGTFLEPLNSKDKERVMIEYSQPNTHKAFHVGHMRNAALGDSLVRIYEQMGHSVVAANYFGDEGAHIAKCLWYLQKHVSEQNLNLDDIKEDQRGEFLGSMYSAAVDHLDMTSLTAYPFPGVIAAKVQSVTKHPDSKAPPNWNVVNVDTGNKKIATVVCGGTNYSIGDLVAYMPVGTTFNDNVISAKDMKGVISHGIIMGFKELGIKTDEEKAEEKKKSEDQKRKKDEELKRRDEKKYKEESARKLHKDIKKDGSNKNLKDNFKDDKNKNSKKEHDKKDSNVKKDANDKNEFKKVGSHKNWKDVSANDKKNKNKKSDGDKKDKLSSKIFVIKQADVKVGELLAEFGKFTELKLSSTVTEELTRRNNEVGAILLAMETAEPTITKLWQKTKAWSIAEFKKIYKWLDCRFDHDFFESEVGEESKRMVSEFHKKGVLKESNGAIVADLKEFKLGVLVLLKSNGAGLYATKDLALARTKFDKFKIDKSLYIVDAAQTLHFQQVFKTLELFGYDQSKKCVHLPYGLVVLASGKMSSRKGTVIPFSALVKMLTKQIDKDYLNKYMNVWPNSELELARQLIAVATIKYGMLNHDTAKDIVFTLEDWTARGGMTGPYMMYAYARTQSIEREVPWPENVKESDVDLSILNDESERATLTMMHNFWPVVSACLNKNNPSGLCEYLYDLAKSYSTWYASTSVKFAINDQLQAARLLYNRAFGRVLKRGLYLLGIRTIDRL